jgi:DNA-binding CsgD family transcriptional regulator
MAANRHYKNSLFSLLFGNPAALRELYEAIAGLTLPPDVPITVNTLEGVLYMTMLNDLSFEIGGRLVVLIEHQSTINPNMAVRLLMYIARVYEKLTAGKNLYGRKGLVIPRPEFIVLYNGVEPYPDVETLRLSKAFADACVLGIPWREQPALELTVKVYNINQGRNPGIIQRSRKLEGYSIFIAKARECTAEIAGGRKPLKLSEDEKDEAMKRAIDWCLAHDILKPFFETHGSEVRNMLFNEWKLEDALVVEREEGREEGREEAVNNLLAFGMKPEQISLALKLPLETVLRYQSK